MREVRPVKRTKAEVELDEEISKARRQLAYLIEMRRNTRDMRPKPARPRQGRRPRR